MPVIRIAAQTKILQPVNTRSIARREDSHHAHHRLRHRRGIECQEAIKLLHRRRELPVLAGKGFYFNGMTHDSFIVNYQRKEDCLSHETYDEIIDMPWRTEQLPVGECVAHIKSALGAQAVIELEREIVRAFHCQACGTHSRCSKRSPG